MHTNILIVFYQDGKKRYLVKRRYLDIEQILNILIKLLVMNSTTYTRIIH
jgi:hypothetical protein